MKRLRAVAVISTLLMVAACSRGGAFNCADTQRYAQRDTIPPLVVPEGLDPPDQAQSLVIPAPTDRAATLDNPQRPCLELPPSYEEAA